MISARDSLRRFTGAARVAAARAAVARWRAGLLAIGLGVLTAGAVFRLRAGFNPRSLWLDDQWVAVLVRHASLPELFQLKAPGPLGFLLLLKAVAAAAGFGAWQLQLLPLVFGVAQIAVIGWIAYRLTDRAMLGLFAAALLAGSRTLAVYSLRVKQFTLEGFVVLVLIALAMLCLRRLRGWTFWLLLAAAAAAMAFSFTAAPVGLVIVNGITLHVFLARRDELKVSRRAVAAGCAAYDLIVLAWVGLFQAHQANELIVQFWSDYYLPLNDPSALWSFATVQIPRFLTGALPSNLGWFAIGAPLGIALLCGRTSTRSIGLALLVFYGGLLAASALQLYPLGGRRTDVFSYPVTILAITGAVWVLSRRVWFLPEVAMIVVFIEILLFFPEPRVHYSRQAGRGAIEMVNALAGDGDGLIVAPRANWALGCYGRWPIQLVRADDSSNGFVVQVSRGQTLVLRESWEDMDIRQARAAVGMQLELFLADAPRRLFFVSIGRWPVMDEWIEQVIEGHEYMVRPLAAPDEGTVLLYERDAADPEGIALTAPHGLTGRALCGGLGQTGRRAATTS